jgi:tRNA pseudouridine38-40 synthase
MHAAAQALLGEHDFSAFRSVECQSKTPMRRVERIEVRREGDCVWLEIAANAYLHHMVRNIVGTLLEVQREPIRGAMAHSRRRRSPPGGRHRAAAGLYLWRVDYPAELRHSERRPAAFG